MDLFTRGEKAFLSAYGRYDIILEKGEGVYLYDTNQNKYLDFFAGIGVSSLGYGYQPYVQALQKQIETLMHVSNYFYTPVAIEAAEAVKKATQLDGVFFCNSGAEATEGALKLARKYYYLKHGKADSEIISFHHSFHGRSTGAVKLTGNPHYQEAFGPLIEGVQYATLNDLKSVETLINERTAAIIVEPLQGEGGLYPCHQDFMQGLRKLCDQHDICLILDEVQCGMGRTGTIMTYFQYGILPDIVCLAKGIGCGVPVGAFVANEKFAKAMEPGDHGSTYGGNPFVCAAVKTVFDILEKENLIQHVQDISEYLIERLEELVDEFNIIESRRGLGLMQGLVFSQDVKPIIKALLNDGVIVVSAGTNVLRMLPPFIIEEQHVDEFINKLKNILKTYQ